MLRLERVNKYFNRHKKNQIHVIDNTSFELGDNGLVALLGPSGCGKTTLLNTIGGLDKINSGKIFINGKRITKKSASTMDKIRVLNIGYIFQDYNLLDDKTVFDNIAISLKMIGVKNRLEIKKKTEYVLQKVGMYRFRNKLAGNLSGGQRQRVGIARAIVKNPSIIIADEPTGNLDSKNTIEVMNIIKSISKDKLVILVTHEKDLAYFYASRIIEIEDGQVKNDYENNHENELDYKIDNKFYLKDFKTVHELNATDSKINIYSDNKESLNVDIVIKNGNIYIKSNNYNKLEIVDDESSIEFIDDHYKKITKEDYEKTGFDLKELENKHKQKYSSIYNNFSMLKAGFEKIANYTIMKKLLLFGFFASAMFIVYAVSNILAVTEIKDSKFVTMNKDYLVINNQSNDVSKYLELENNELITYMMPGDSKISGKVNIYNLYQLRYAEVSLSGSLADSSLIQNIILGNTPTNDYEIVIDKSVFNMEDYVMVNISSNEDFIGKKFKIGNLPEFTIVGICDSLSPSIYVNKSMFLNILTNSVSTDGESFEVQTSGDSNVKDYNLYSDKLTLKRGKLPQNDYEIIVNYNNRDAMPLNKTIETKINKTKLKVVGYFTSSYDDNNYYASSNTIKINLIDTTPNIIVYSEDKDAALAGLQDLGYNVEDSYAKSRKTYIKSVKDSIVKSVIIAGILLVISLVEIILMVRASFMSRIKEVGIYRAIGVKRGDIYKMFAGEILVITTIAGVPGYILMSLILNEMTKISYFANNYVMNSNVLIISIVFIYGFNLLMGLLPVRSVVKSTPAAILSRTDVD